MTDNVLLFCHIFQSHEYWKTIITEGSDIFELPSRMGSPAEFGFDPRKVHAICAGRWCHGFG